MDLLQSAVPETTTHWLPGPFLAAFTPFSRLLHSLGGIHFCATASLTTSALSYDGIIRSNTREAVLDLIVRDKKGHLVRDLEAPDISVFEDGIKQKINSFRNVEGEEQLTAETRAQQLEAVSPSEPPRP